MKGYGYTFFKPTGIKTDFTHIDLDKKEATATVSYKGKIYMIVKINIESDTITVVGDVEELAHLTTKDGFNAMDQEAYINMFKSQAEFFIENNISDPKKYYE